MKYTVEITEISKRKVEIEAESLTEAENMIEQCMLCGKYTVLLI